MSIRKLFEEELAGLKTELVEMCRLTEQMLDNAITALINRDRELGKSIGQMDKRVDDFLAYTGDIPNLWTQVILPSAATLLYVLIVILDGKEHFYKTAIPVWMMAIYGSSSL